MSTTSLQDCQYAALTPADEDGYARAVKLSFNSPRNKVDYWYEMAGRENFRVVRHQNQVAGGWLLIPMGQWFGGRSVSMVGVAGVVINPEFRGGGIATRMMQHAVGEMYEQGFALSALFPSTQSLYRRAGYEAAGSWFEIRVPAKLIPKGRRDLPVRPFQPADLKAIQNVYAGVAQRSQGYLDRGPYIWERIQRSVDETFHGYVIEDDGEITGYIFYHMEYEQGWRYRMLLTDFVAANSSALERLYGFLTDYKTMSSEIVWEGSPHDPLLSLFPEQSFEVSLKEYWMLRVINLKKALEERGWPIAVQAEIHLDVDDPHIPQNHGKWILKVENGRAQVSPGGTGRVQTDIRGMAMLYSGFQSPQTLRALGALQGTEEDLAICATLFSGALPSMLDLF